MDPNPLLLAYYGDDFTGSTDALEFLNRAGIKTALFIEPPTAAQLQRFEGLQAFGVAGRTRSLPPDEMETVLHAHFTALKETGTRHVHYKVCSTFDSSPTIGSIGKAIDVGSSVFENAFVPLLVAAPALGRYCAFGNLFARMGIGSKGQIFRLDRHPSMSRHPVTPATESDLRLHLSRQTGKQIGLVDILQVNADYETAEEALKQQIGIGAEIVLFDALYAGQMAGIGRLIDAYAGAGKPLFSAGSSGIEMALGAYWEQQGITSPQSWATPGKTETLLVASGSCSPVTAGQIAKAEAGGFATIALDTAAIASEETMDLGKYITEAVQYMAAGHSVIIHTSLGADDERIETTDTVFRERGLDADAIRTETARLYGTALGLLVKAIAEQVNVQRIVIAGGDTSSYAARAMGIEAVEMIAPLSPGAPLCRAYAPASAIDGCEVNFKGGQVGDEDYFERVLKGR